MLAVRSKSSAPTSQVRKRIESTTRLQRSRDSSLRSVFAERLSSKELKPTLTRPPRNRNKSTRSSCPSTLRRRKLPKLLRERPLRKPRLPRKKSE